MTAAQYFEMCEALGEQPVDADVPVEYEDFALEIQQILQIYNLLSDTWEGFNGLYLGKNLTGIKDLLELFQIDSADTLIVIQTIKLLDRIRMEEQNRRTEKPAK